MRPCRISIQDQPQPKFIFVHSSFFTLRPLTTAINVAPLVLALPMSQDTCRTTKVARKAPATRVGSYENKPEKILHLPLNSTHTTGHFTTGRWQLCIVTASSERPAPQSVDIHMIRSRSSDARLALALTLSFANPHPPGIGCLVPPKHSSREIEGCHRSCSAIAARRACRPAPMPSTRGPRGP